MLHQSNATKGPSATCSCDTTAAITSPLHAAHSLKNIVAMIWASHRLAGATVHSVAALQKQLLSSRMMLRGGINLAFPPQLWRDPSQVRRITSPMHFNCKASRLKLAWAPCSVQIVRHQCKGLQRPDRRVVSQGPAHQKAPLSCPCC